ncbi:hypothetical protein PC116_g32000 [Phytophthora cactorum]|nr:hypothetical protein PC116_g32000 [Phytophthora cactorum]
MWLLCPVYVFEDGTLSTRQLLVFLLMTVDRGLVTADHTDASGFTFSYMGYRIALYFGVVL